ncbi:hypothetical protein O3S80_16750 [Streptomyces sp. Lzd4kr]|nr:hypothetical protein [Streptomyces sp. Lzd4kr]
MHSPLPLHPRTGARALGWRKARPGEDDDQLYPIWPILGGAEGDDQDGDGDDEADGSDDDGQDGDDSGDQDGDGADADAGDGGDDDDPEGADKLGDPGKRALASMKGKWRSERDKRRELERLLADKDAAGSGSSKDDADTIRRQAEAAATVKANTRIVRSEVRAAAAGKLADPKDALTFLDLSQFEVNEDGEIDAEEVSDAIDELIKAKPYLAAATAKPRFQGTGDGGAARKASRPKQLTENDLKTMSPEAIDKAHKEGRFDDLLGGG